MIDGKIEIKMLTQPTKQKRKFHLDINFRYFKAGIEPFDEKRETGGFRAGVGVEYSF